jgi:hypothetical protein
MFQTLALQQLGKLINPISGKMERDLQQARVTIDMLQMVQEKTAGNLTAREQGLIGGIITELQLNYVDELKRAEEPESKAEGGEEEKEKETGDAAAEAREEAGTGAREAADEAGKTEPAKKKKTRKRKTKAKKKSDSDGRD